MKKIALVLALASALGALALAPAEAQQAQANPEFDNAPVTDVLKWAQESIGCGFIYEGEDLNDPESGKLRRITASHVEPETTAEKTLLLFELLRRCGLVPFEVGGMPGPTYQLYTVEDAARSADIVTHPRDLNGRYFASLSIRLRRANVQSVSVRVRRKLTPDIGSVEVFEDTHTMIVTDFSDRLVAAWEVAINADEPVMRDDDLVVQNYAVQNGVAARYVAALERLRESDEDWKATVNETSNVLLFSGTRAQVSRVMDRLRRLDAMEENPAFAESTQTIKLIYAKPGEAVRTLREMFEHEIAAGSVQIGGFERDRKVVFRGTQYDYERAAAAVKAFDLEPKDE